MNKPETPYLSPAIDLIRALRLSGRASEARSLMSTFAASPPADIFIGQIGIDLSYLGMTEQAVPFLRRGLASNVSPLAAYQLREELCMALYSLGQYHEANALQRINRDRECAAEFLYTLTRGDRPWIDLLLPKLPGIDEPVAGRSIMILIEGGFGDFVMYSRYVDRLLREGAREVVIEVFDEWRDVIRPREGVTFAQPTPDARQANARRCDRVVTLFHLFARYQRSPYFPADDPAAMIALDGARPMPADVETSLRAGGKALKVGLIWRSGSGVRHEPYRSMTLAQLTGVLSNDACRFYSLQVGGTTTQADDERALMQAHGVTDLAAHLHSFGDTARVLNELDLLICVDTGPAHLAGALNRPVWMLLAQSCDCRWYDCQRHTPWYPSMRLYRQRELGDWTAPLADLNADLSRLAASAKDEVTTSAGQSL